MAQSNFPLYKKTLKAYNNIFGSKNNKAKIEWGAWNSQKAFKSVKMYEWCHLGILIRKIEKTPERIEGVEKLQEWSM